MITITIEIPDDALLPIANSDEPVVREFAGRLCATCEREKRPNEALA